MIPGRSFRIWDFIGMGLSLACLVHCLALPFLLAALPTLALGLDHGNLHLVLIVMVLPVAGLALVPAYLRTRASKALFWGLGGITLLTAGLLLGYAERERLETVLSILGACCLFRAHWLNHNCRCGCPKLR